jgi:hypothetical protein
MDDKTWADAKLRWMLERFVVGVLENADVEVVFERPLDLDERIQMADALREWL